MSGGFWRRAAAITWIVIRAVAITTVVGTAVILLAFAAWKLFGVAFTWAALAFGILALLAALYVAAKDEWPPAQGPEPRGRLGMMGQPTVSAWYWFRPNVNYPWRPAEVRIRCGVRNWLLTLDQIHVQFYGAMEWRDLGEKELAAYEWRPMIVPEGVSEFP